MKRTLKHILLGINILVVICLLFSYLSIYIPSDRWWIPSFFGLAYPFILTANIIFIIFWLMVKPKYMLLSIISILIGWSFLSRYIQFSGKTIEKGDIKVLSYNVQNFYGGGNNQIETADSVLDFLKIQNADVICLQETSIGRRRVFNLENIVTELSTINHYQYARTVFSSGLVTLTRYPIINMGEIRFENSTNMVIYTDVLIDVDTVRIFNVHLQSYLIDPSQYDVVESLDFTEVEDLREIRNIGSKLKTAFQRRAAQVREIRNFIDNTPYHILVCGDFNDTPASFSYYRLRGDLEDAFVSSGKGIGRTYVGRLPSFRIDNILYSKGFESYNFSTYDLRLSDHLPISCDLVKN